jgi:ABC-type bacteriocin/lantibiotic exporter with double-glycine peptidase domain
MHNSILRVKALFHFSKRWRKYALYSLFLSITLAILNLPYPFVMRYMVDKLIPAKNIPLLLHICILLLLLYMITLSLSSINIFCLAYFRHLTLVQLKTRLFSHILYVPYSFFKDSHVGYLISRIVSDTEKVQGLFADTFISFLINITSFLIGSCAMFYLNWKLALIALLILPIFLLLNHRYSSSIRHASTNVQDMTGRVSGFIGEHISGIHLIKSLNAEKRTSLRFYRALRAQFGANMLWLRSSMFMGVGSSLYAYLCPLVIMYLGFREIMLNNMTLGSYFAFSMFLSYMYQPAQSIMTMNVMVQDSMAALRRVNDLLALTIEDEDREDLIHSINLGGNIEFREVTFSYNNKKNAIDHVSFKLDPGNIYSFVGKSGCGKSTIINLICKYYIADDGDILFDGISIHDIRSGALRKNISVISQSPFLFSGSIRDNIAMAKPRASLDEIVEAAETANIHNYIETLEKGYETEIGERGINLSGGERQRIAIARAVLKRASILIFDEATSEIDNETEMIIQSNIHRKMKYATFIMVSHRMSSLVISNEILYFDEGRLVAQGTHEELCSKNESYRKGLSIG